MYISSFIFVGKHRFIFGQQSVLHCVQEVAATTIALKRLPRGPRSGKAVSVTAGAPGSDFFTSVSIRIMLHLVSQ